MTIIGEDIGVASGDIYHAGTDLDVRFAVVDDETGQPVDLTNVAALVWRVFPLPRGPHVGTILPDPVFTKTLTGTVIVTSGPGGMFTAPVVPADTQSLSGYHFHVARVTLANGKQYVSTEGLFLITSRGAL